MLAAAVVAVVLLWTGTASALQPIQPLGPQHRLTQQGVDGTQDVDARFADVAYNSQRNEFLVVWENLTSAPFDREIFARRLAADGSPLGSAFQVSGLAGSTPTADASDPAVAYNPERDQYGVSFVREEGSGVEARLQLVSGDGVVVEFDGTPGPQPVLASNISAGAPRETDIVYRADANNDSIPGDRWVVAYAGDEVTANEFEIFVSSLSATSGSGTIDIDVSNMVGATADAFDPSITLVPGGDDVALAFEATLNGSETEIFARRMPGNLPDGAGAQTQITTTGAATGSAFDAGITANPDRGELLVAYRGDEVDGDFEVHVQRLDLGLGQLGTDDQQVSSAGSPGSGGTFTVVAPAVEYHRSLGQYLVTWIGNDDGRPGFANDEEEITGTVLDSNGAELAPQDFPISRMGAPNDDAPLPSDATVAANTQTGRWLSVWGSDDAQPPLADGEFELWGRQVGENFDVDGDGVAVPADCNDGNAGIRPGAVDVFDNGVDEDCSGADAENPDRDGDGATRPGDCDDGNPAIRPGIADVVNNEVDENCDGRLERRIVDVDVERFFAVFTDHTRVTRLRVRKLRPGMRIELRCSGKKCPKELRKRKVRRVSVKKAGSRDFAKLFKKARLKPKAVIDVRVFQPSAIARVDRFIFRKAKLPKRELRCIPPGVKKPAKC